MVIPAIFDQDQVMSEDLWIMLSLKFLSKSVVLVDRVQMSLMFQFEATLGLMFVISD